eukprot:6111904-Pleurochrysis_carterae.AAC.5
MRLFSSNDEAISQLDYFNTRIRASSMLTLSFHPTIFRVDLAVALGDNPSRRQDRHRRRRRRAAAAAAAEAADAARHAAPRLR